MIITYSGRSRPTALVLADEDEDISLNRGSEGDINWGRSSANTRLNPDISNATNKRRMRQLFAEHDVPTPVTWTPQEVLSFSTNSYAWPLVGRPDNHSKGRGFWFCRNMNDVRRALRGTRTKRAATHFMEYIDAPREYRVHIFDGMSIRISEKIFHGTDGNHKLYTTGKPQHPIKHVRKAAKQAVEALGLDFGAVDILANDDECWVLEVNAAPGLGGTLPRLYVENFNRWCEENDV